MKLNRNALAGVLFAATAYCLGAAPAFAATRTVYFNQSGMNKTTNGLSPQSAGVGAVSTCKITISNPSQTSQNFTMTFNVSSLDKWNGGDSGTSTAGGLPCPASGVPLNGCIVSNSSGATISCSGTSCSGSINANANVQVTLPFSAYPARSTNPNHQNSYQKLRCSGSIVAIDQAAPGFLIANGVLVTFVESAKMSTDGVTSGSTVSTNFGGLAVYTQVPISINRGKAF